MLETDRLILRRWDARDLAPFAALNADHEVMRYFPKALLRSESDAFVARLEDRWTSDGISIAVAERKGDAAFIGMVGLAHVRFAPLEGAVEIGWRLARTHWGQGYATEAARGWLRHAFEAMGLAEVIAFTVPENLASQRVMERLGMRRDPGRDFEHPSLPEGHPLRPHVVFSIRREDWAG
jgi:ribosomal-protein-alanine N-acetyltransferase